MRVKVIHGVTISKSLKLMKGLPSYLDSKGLDITIVTSDGPEVNEFEDSEKCKVKIINIEREISLFKDFMSLIKIIKYFQREKPAIVNAGTPKAGLLMMIAAWITGVPNRIYTLRGLRLETTQGLKRMILTLMEKIAMFCSTEIIAISPSLKEASVKLNLSKEKKIKVLGKGSSNGIDLKMINENLEENLKNLKAEKGIETQEFLIGYVGRLTKDKGVELLVNSFLEMRERKANVKLLLVGEFEKSDPLSKDVEDKILTHPDILYFGYQKNPYPYFQLIDVFVFLSYREGFGNVSIEAAAYGKPVIVQNATGARDTIIDNKTGFIVDGSIEDIVNKLMLLKNNSSLQKEMGENGQKWVRENFDRNKVHSNIYNLYNDILM